MCADLQVALCAVHEDGLALVEEDDGVVDLGLAEDELQDGARRVGAERGEVDHQYLLPNERRERIGHHRLARAAGPVEEQHEPPAVGELLVELQVP